MKLLVCGTRKKGYEDAVDTALTKILETKKVEAIIEGCCPNSADAYAEEWAKQYDIPLSHFPSTSGNYLKRNREMVNSCDEVLACWDGFSYGTAHTIATAVSKGLIGQSKITLNQYINFSEVKG